MFTTGGIMPISISARRKAGVLVARSSLIPGNYIPGLTANSVGVLSGTTFTDVFPDSGTNITATALPAGTYTNYRFFGNFRLTSGSGTYTFVNCMFAGHDPSLTPTAPYDGMCVNYGNSLAFNFTDCSFDGWEWNRVYSKVHHVYRSVNDDYVDLKGYVNSIGFKGRRATFTRCEFVNLQDGFQIQGDDVGIFQCAIWKNQYMSGDPSFGGSNYTHCDGVQWMYGDRGEVAYNMVGGRRILTGYTSDPPANQGEDCYNAGFMIKNETGAALGLNVHDNWIGGGAASINMITANGDDLSGVTIADNKILRRPATVVSDGYQNDHTAGSNYYIVKNTTTPTITGNVKWDLYGDIHGTAEAVPVS